MRDLFAPAGTSGTDEEVSAETQRIDVWFVPDPTRLHALEPLGWLGQLARTPSGFDPFHRTPGVEDVLGCVRKHLVWRQVLTLRSAPVLIPEGITPWMWVISAGVSEEALRQFGFHRDPQREGLYALPPAFTVGLVAVSQLPRIRETLLLRLMGAGRTLRMAMEDLTALPPNALEARIVVPHLLRLKLLLVTSTEPEDQEFTMETEDIFSKLVCERAEDYERGIRQGIQQGVQQGV